LAPELADSSDHYPVEEARRQAELEESFFWFRARADLVTWCIGRYFPSARSLFEIGCGTGAVLAAVQASRPDVDLYGADLSVDALRVAQQRVPDAALAQMDIRRIPYRDEFDVVCALDVLEHVDEDEAALRELRHAVKPGGGLLLSVPQHAWLWSALDEFGKHRRRYARRGAVELVRTVGFDVLRVTSSVTFLLPLVAISRFRNRRLRPDYDPFGEMTLPPRLNRLFGRVMRFERAVTARGVSMPFGSSLVIVARRPA
jgi:SAM-dependent methyltransferase